METNTNNELMEEIKHVDVQDVEEAAVVKEKAPTTLNSLFSALSPEMVKLQSLEETCKQTKVALKSTEEVLIGRKSTPEERTKLYNTLSTGKVKLDDLSTEEILKIIKDVYGVKDIFKSAKDSLTDDSLGFGLKEYVKLAVSTDRLGAEFDKAMKEQQLALQQFNKEIEDLLGSANISDSVSALQKEIDVEENPEVKAKMIAEASAMQISVNLGFIFDKVKNKPIAILRKEAKKDNMRTYNRMLNMMEKSKRMFIGCRGLTTVLNNVFEGYNQDDIKLMVYLIARYVTKGKEFTDTTAAFVNHYSLAIRKIITSIKADNEEYKDNLTYKRMKKFLDEIK